MSDEDQSITDIITDQAQAPASESIDGQSVTERPLTELIEADKHTQGGKALQTKRMGLIFRKFTQGSALG